MDEEGRVLVLDLVTPAGNEPNSIKDIVVLMMALEEGHARTEQEFQATFQRAGLRVTRILPIWAGNNGVNGMLAAVCSPAMAEAIGQNERVFHVGKGYW